MAEFTAALKASQSGARYFATVRSWLDENGLALDADAFLGRPDACVVVIPRVLQPNQERVGERYVFAGPCIDETRTEGWTPPPGDDRPLVYVSMGTAYTDVPDLYERIVTELRETSGSSLATGKVDPARCPGVARRAHPAAARRARARRRLHHPRRHGRRGRVAVVRRPDRRGARRRSTSSPTPPSSRRSGRASSWVSRGVREAVGAALDVCAAGAGTARDGARERRHRRAPPTRSSGSAERGPEVALGVGEEAAGEAHDVEVVVLASRGSRPRRARRCGRPGRRAGSASGWR